MHTYTHMHTLKQKAPSVHTQMVCECEVDQLSTTSKSLVVHIVHWRACMISIFLNNSMLLS